MRQAFGRWHLVSTSSFDTKKRAQEEPELKPDLGRKSRETQAVKHDTGRGGDDDHGQVASLEVLGRKRHPDRVAHA